MAGGDVHRGGDLAARVEAQGGHLADVDAVVAQRRADLEAPALAEQHGQLGLVGVEGALQIGIEGERLGRRRPGFAIGVGAADTAGEDRLQRAAAQADAVEAAGELHPADVVEACPLAYQPLVLRVDEDIDEHLASVGGEAEALDLADGHLLVEQGRPDGERLRLGGAQGQPSARGAQLRGGRRGLAGVAVEGVDLVAEGRGRPGLAAEIGGEKGDTAVQHPRQRPGGDADPFGQAAAHLHPRLHPEEALLAEVVEKFAVDVEVDADLGPGSLQPDIDHLADLEVLEVHRGVRRQLRREVGLERDQLPRPQWHLRRRLADDLEVVLKVPVAGLEGDLRAAQQQLQVVDAAGRNLRLDQPEPRAGAENHLGTGVEEDMGGDGALQVVVEGDILDKADLGAAVDDFRRALDDVLAGGQGEGHGDAVLGGLEVGIEVEDVAVLRHRGGLQLFRGVEEDAAAQQRGQRFHLDLQCRQLAADMNAAGVAETAALAHQVGELRLDEELDGDVFVTLQLILLHLADLDVAVVDASADLDRAEYLGLELEMQSGGVGGHRRHRVEAGELPARGRRGADLDADIAAGEDGVEAMDGTGRELRAHHPEKGVVDQLVGDRLVHPHRGGDLLVLEVGLHPGDQADGDAAGHDLGLAGDDAGGVAEVDGDLDAGVTQARVKEPGGDGEGDQWQDPDDGDGAVLADFGGGHGCWRERGEG